MILTFDTKRKAFHSENTAIEKNLHPLITIDGALITHRHVGRNIYFQAWVNDAPINNRELQVDRNTILYIDDFYKRYRDELVWLVGKEKETK